MIWNTQLSWSLHARPNVDLHKLWLKEYFWGFKWIHFILFTNLWFVLLYVVLIKTDGGLMGGGGQISCFGSSFGSVNDPINTDYCSFTFASSCTSFSHEINVCCMFVFVCARARLYTFIFLFFHFILHFMLNLWCVCTYLSTMSVGVFVCVFVHVHKGVCFLCLFVRLHACMCMYSLLWCL